MIIGALVLVASVVVWGPLVAALFLWVVSLFQRLP